MSKLTPLELERLDLSYRTGIKLTAEEMQKALLKEQGYAGLLSIPRKGNNVLLQREN